MGYSLHIERERQAISLAEWTAAVSKVSGVRMESADIQGGNPATGELISVGGTPGNAAVLFNTNGNENWETCLFFRRGRISFAATEEVESADDPVRIAVVALAKELNAQIVGDEGEMYRW